MSMEISAAQTAIQRVLEERAERLARPLAEPSTARAIEVLHFELAGERYAIETAFLHHVTRLPRVFAVPDVPAHFAGIVNLHGESLVVDLCPVLGLAPAGVQPDDHVLFLGRDRVEFGIIVRAVHSIDSISAEDLPPPTGAQTEQPLVRGILPSAEVILDGAALLDDPRFTIESNHLPASQGEKG